MQRAHNQVGRPAPGPRHSALTGVPAAAPVLLHSATPHTEPAELGAATTTQASTTQAAGWHGIGVPQCFLPSLAQSWPLLLSSWWGVQSLPGPLSSACGLHAAGWGKGRARGGSLSSPPSSKLGGHTWLFHAPASWLLPQGSQPSSPPHGCCSPPVRTRSSFKLYPSPMLSPLPDPDPGHSSREPCGQAT